MTYQRHLTQVPASSFRPPPRQLRVYLVGISYRDGSAENVYVNGFSVACTKAEKASLSPEVAESCIWSGWTPIRDYVAGEVVKEHDGVPAY